MYQTIIKRVFDIVLATVGILIVMPLVIVLAVFIWLTMGRSVFYKQDRPGLRGRPFKIWKFRTMRDIYSTKGTLAPDHERLTEFGRFLRRSSLDELPELVNVLRGDMSLVGPRPLLMDYLDRYSPVQARRMEVKPGITGWAQVKGRNAIDWETKFRLDVWYVDNISFLKDVEILGLTILKVFTREGISHENHVTMPGFRGTKE